MANLLESLKSKLRYTVYTPKSEAEILEQAQNRYASAYRQKALDAQQAYERENLARQREMEDLRARYDWQAEAVREEARQSAAEADRHALSRGMQRSSYNAQTLANIRAEGDRAGEAVEGARLQAEDAIGREGTLAAGQLADTLAQMRQDYASDVAAYADALRDREYERANASTRYANELVLAMYEHAAEQQRRQEEQNRWLMEFTQSVRQYEESRRGKSSGGSSSGKRKSAQVSGIREVPPERAGASGTEHGAQAKPGGAYNPNKKDMFY